MVQDLNENTSLLGYVHLLPQYNHAAESSSHTQYYWYVGSDDPHGFYVLPAGDADPVQLADSASIPSGVTTGYNKKMHVAASTSPAVTDDSGDGYLPGQVWYRTDFNRLWVLLDNSLGAAIWQPVMRYTEASVDPTAYNDVSAGFQRGDIYINTVTNVIFICLWPYPANAQWRVINQERHNLTATTDPGVGDDFGDFYFPGSLWYNATSRVWWMCTDAAVGAAVWVFPTDNTLVHVASGEPSASTYGSGGRAGHEHYDETDQQLYIQASHYSGGPFYARLVMNKLAAIDPTTASDLTAGYRKGAFFTNTVTKETFICLSDAGSAAVWGQATGPLYSEIAASTPPTLTELQTAWPANAALPTYQVLLNPGGADTDYFLCSRVGNIWSYAAQMLAV